MRLDGTIMAVALDDETGFSQPVELFQIALPRTETFDVFDVAPDGGRFLVLEWDGPPEPLTLVQNWPALSSP